MRKELGTMATLIWFFWEVRADMNLKQGSLGKALETLATSPDTSLKVVTVWGIAASGI